MTKQDMTPSPSPSPLTPAELLVGRTLPNGWQVEELLTRPDDATGGHFSTSYIVRSGRGERAFLKAMDYRRALEAPDPALALQSMTAAYTFEREMLTTCQTNRLTRIVTILDDGRIPAEPNDPSSVVQYLIFELATGDIRSVVRFGQATDHAWILRTIHDATVALRQLHSAQIAHQDVKPSNILLFPEEHSKLGDLGRSSHRHIPSPHDDLTCAGDLSYAPPELLYGYVDPDWRTRRIATDLYLLGSLILYLCTGVSFTHLLLSRVDRKHHFRSGVEYVDALPHLQRSFAQILRELPNSVPSDISSEITESVRQLCNPQPAARGHPKNARFGTSRYSLERYVSLFGRLAKRAAWSLRQTVVWRS